jgi:hypothetical protein
MIVIDLVEVCAIRWDGLRLWDHDEFCGGEVKFEGREEAFFL